MKIVLIGARGNLGSQLSQVYAAEQLEAWDREEVDFLDHGSLAEHLRLAQPDLIINAAAYNAVDKCEQDEGEKALAFQLNRDLPAALAEMALELSSVLVHYSTDYVFAGNQPEGYSEDDSPEPQNVYGRSKLAGEQLVSQAAAQGLRAYIIRTSKLFGPRGDSAFAKPSFFALMSELAAKQAELRVVDEESSAFTYTPDLAAATRTLIAEYQPGLYHLTNTGSATWYEAARLWFDIVGQSVKVVPVSGQAYPRPAVRPKFSSLLNTKGPQLPAWEQALRRHAALDR